MLSLLTTLALLVQGPVPDAAPDPFLAFAQELEAGIAAGNAEQFDDRFDFTFLMERALGGLALPPEERDGFDIALRGSLRFGPGIVFQVLQNMGTYHLVRMLPAKEGFVRALFRLQSASAFDYHELYLGRNADGAVRIVDLHRHTEGQRLTERIRRGLRSSTFDLAPEQVVEVAASERAYLESFGKRLLIEQVLEGDPARALELIAKLEPRVRNDESMLLQRLNAARRVGLEQHQAALAALEEHRPASSALALARLEFHLGEQDLDEARRWIDAKDSEVDDIFFDVFRARLLLQEGALGVARETALRVRDTDPRLARIAGLVLLEVALAAEDHRGTLELLVDLSSQHSIEFGDLNANPDFAAFVKSPSFQAWLER
ncbi:MAG: hypothetical protein WD226_06730 [Planctomycetota bacterium]